MGEAHCVMKGVNVAIKVNQKRAGSERVNKERAESERSAKSQREAREGES